MRESVAVFAALSALISLPMLGAAAPTLSIHADSYAYTLGDTIELRLSGENTGEGMSVDVYVGVFDGIGRVYMLTPEGWKYTRTPMNEPVPLEPWVQDIFVPNGFQMAPAPFEWLELPHRDPDIGQQGHYYFVSLLTYPGTYDWLTQPSVALAFLDTGPGREMKMIDVPGGSFTMGSPESEEGHEAAESPQHFVTVSSFLMAETEITQRQFLEVMGFNPSANRFLDELPVESITWFNAVDFCNWLSIYDGLTPCYTIDNPQYYYYLIVGADVTCDFGANGYRLPTEAEWEYACRAGTTTRYYAGDSETDLFRVGWCADNSAPETHAVAQLEPNALGFYDMHGNIGEFCWDWYDESYYQNSPDADPKGPETGERKARRGGSWFDLSETCRSAYRKNCGTNCWCDASGLRVVRRAD